MRDYLKSLIRRIGAEPVVLHSFIKYFLIVLVQWKVPISEELKVLMSSIIYFAITTYTRNAVVPVSTVATALGMPPDSTLVDLKMKVNDQIKEGS